MHQYNSKTKEKALIDDNMLDLIKYFISSNNSVAKFTDAILLGPLDQHRRQKVGTKCYRNFQLNVRGSTEM